MIVHGSCVIYFPGGIKGRNIQSVGKKQTRTKSMITFPGYFPFHFLFKGCVFLFFRDMVTIPTRSSSQEIGLKALYVGFIDPSYPFIFGHLLGFFIVSLISPPLGVLTSSSCCGGISSGTTILHQDQIDWFRPLELKSGFVDFFSEKKTHWEHKKYQAGN